MENEKVIEFDRNDQDIVKDNLVESESSVESTNNVKEIFSCHFHMDEVNYPFSATKYDGIAYKSKIIGKITECESLWCKAVFYETSEAISYEIKNSVLTIDGYRFSELEKERRFLPVYQTFDKDVELVFDDVKKYDVITKSIQFDLFRTGRDTIAYKPKPNSRIIAHTHNGQAFDMQSPYTSVMFWTSVFVFGKDLFVEIEAIYVPLKEGSPSSELKFFAKLK